MTEQPETTGPSEPTGASESPAPSEAPGPNGSLTDDRLDDYLDRNAGKYTDEALAASAHTAGYSDEQIRAGLARIRSVGSGTVVRARARRAVLLAYLITFGVLVAGMFVSNPTGAVGYSGVLLVSMLIGLALSLVMVRSAGRTAALAVILAGPVIVLVIIAGLCVATGLPFRSIAY